MSKLQANPGCHVRRYKSSVEPSAFQARNAPPRYYRRSACEMTARQMACLLTPGRLQSQKRWGWVHLLTAAYPPRLPLIGPKNGSEPDRQSFYVIPAAVDGFEALPCESSRGDCADGGRPGSRYLPQARPRGCKGVTTATLKPHRSRRRTVSNGHPWRAMCADSCAMRWRVRRPRLLPILPRLPPIPCLVRRSR